MRSERFGWRGVTGRWHLRGLDPRYCCLHWRLILRRPEIAFPWQTAFFAHATICAVMAIVSLRLMVNARLPRSVLTPLNYSVLISIVLGVVCLFQANTWTITWMQAQRVFWIAGILLLLLWLNRRRLILNLFQVALICALVLTVKAVLQEFDWYSFVPHAFLRPAALQIQGTVLALFCLFGSRCDCLCNEGATVGAALRGRPFRRETRAIRTTGGHRVPPLQLPATWLADASCIA